MKSKRSIKIISIVLIFVLICISITYVKSGNKEVLATTKEFNLENLQDNEHMYVEVDSSGDKVPVPNGYVGSKATGENEIDTGYVIYEGTEEVNDSNVKEAKKTRNQYVWIPVPDTSKMYGTDANGKKWGKLYTFTTTVGDNIDEITGTKPLDWSETNGVIQVSNTGHREPDIVVKQDGKQYDIDSTLKEAGINNDAQNFLIELEKEFYGMIESVEKYGGFYIGRYETGNVKKDSFKVRKGEDTTGQSWYVSYISCKNLKGKNTNVETGMIWDCQWDRTLMWLIETGNKTKEEICKDSGTWGNYLGIKFDYENKNGEIVHKVGNEKILTGSSEYTKANNVYDLAGNVSEWTLGARRGDFRCIRSGGNGSYSNDIPARNTKFILSDNFKWMSSNVIHKIGKIVYYVHM